MDTERNGYNAMSMEQLGELLGVVVLYLQANGLKVGVTLLAIDRDGMRTVGNLTPDTQRDAFQMLLERFDSPDGQQWVGLDGKTKNAAH